MNSDSHAFLTKVESMDSRASSLPYQQPRVSVVIPALNEAETIAEVIRSIPGKIVSEIIVVDNGSRDETSERARQAGARVITEARRGYGRACQAGVRAVSPDCQIIVFLDGDGSDHPELIEKLVQPIIDGTHDFVISSRLRGREPGSMRFSQVFAGHMISFILRSLYGAPYTDMGPFRAIRRSVLEQLGMREMTYGWPLEMQMRAVRAGLRILEVPVGYRKRAAGKSKVSGTVSGTIRATWRILFTLARLALK